MVCGGDGGDLLSLYDIQTCAPRHDARIAQCASQQAVMVSQTQVGHRVTTTCASGQCLAVAGPGGSISILRGKFKL